MLARILGPCPCAGWKLGTPSALIRPASLAWGRVGSDGIWLVGFSHSISDTSIWSENLALLNNPFGPRVVTRAGTRRKARQPSDSCGLVNGNVII
jgi:hypothetical protein